MLFSFLIILYQITYSLTMTLIFPSPDFNLKLISEYFLLQKYEVSRISNFKLKIGEGNINIKASKQFYVLAITYFPIKSH